VPEKYNSGRTFIRVENMGNPFTTAAWSMGYTSPLQTPPPVGRARGPEVENPAQDQQWWEQNLAPSVSAGLGDLEWVPADDTGTRHQSVFGVHRGRSVAIRLPRGLERRGSEMIENEVMATVEVPVTPQPLGLWVVESPPKWFRGRRAWALNRPPFKTGDPWFDEQAGCWAWDCTAGSDALRDALAPALPALREILETQPGAIITNTTISAWIPHTEMPERLPKLLAMAQSLADLAGSGAVAARRLS
jgi:hypothetical protein